ncbi:hypothetical protein AVEN_203598-1 [Araneus ventricosus]|uniref:Uncharacterized protein n=1 Tax=Araneus ventricosus TaxID=182803 RepID=A0A4Y2JX24_ARAVE|nr:hypothetical protein AVEN_203598-1 [Araneus ventricosus]
MHIFKRNKRVEIMPLYATWQRQLLDSIKDFHADNEQNRRKTTERTCLSRFGIFERGIRFCILQEEEESEVDADNGQLYCCKSLTVGVWCKQSNTQDNGE